MKAASARVLKAALSRCSSEKRASLERFLPASERQSLEKLPDYSADDGFEFAIGGMLEYVHWSWFLPTLKTYGSREQKLFLCALSPLAAENLAQELGITAPSEEISETARSFLRQLLLHSLIGPGEGLLSVEDLPYSPLKGLLKLSKKELIGLIDRLSLYDLAVEVRQIVETKILKKIYSFLSEGQLKFLKAISSHKEPFTLARLGLDRWDGQESTLRTLLHRRGLARLGIALSGQDPDLIWYVCHELDIGRGNALFKLCAKEPAPQASDAIAIEIEELMENPENLL